LWLKKHGAVTEDYEELCTEVNKKVGLELDFGGLYKWIVFLPSKTHPDIPVLNRYYGVKENGKLKFRGLEVRRRDTPKFVYDAQLEMLNVLASANDAESCVKKIPDALRVFKKYRKKLLAGEVTVWDLIVTKRVSKELDAYTQNISQKIAGEQLVNDGFEISPGKSVKFLFVDAKNKRHNRRVIAKELIEERTNLDLQKYLSFLYSAAESVLSPFNYSAKEVQDFVLGYKQISIN
jgi:DNA polymerase elongation subunit (family B)